MKCPSPLATLCAVASLLFALSANAATTLPMLSKNAELFDNGNTTAETTLTYLPDGRMVAITFGGHDLIIRDPFTAKLIKSIPTPGGMYMGTAISFGGLLHVFGTTPLCNYLKPGGSIVHATIDMNWEISAPDTIYMPPPRFNICNLGITATPHGWVMSVETQLAKRWTYSPGIFFLTASDINGTWSRTGIMAYTGSFIGSPKIRYSFARDEFFVTYSAQLGKTYYTTAAKMPSDLSAFVPFAGNDKLPADTAILAPDLAADMINASDVTYVEHDGHVEGIYADGNQDTTAHLRRFSYPGSVEQFEQQFFPIKVRNAGHAVSNGG